MPWKYDIMQKKNNVAVGDFALCGMNLLKNEYDKFKFLKSSKFKQLIIWKMKGFQKEECQLLFKLKIKDPKFRHANVKVNFQKQHDEIWCLVC